MSSEKQAMNRPVDIDRPITAGPVRIAHPVYVNFLPPCNEACPAGENIQAWLALAQAEEFELAWRELINNNPFPAIHGRVCYHPCETSCNRKDMDNAVMP